MQPLLHPLLWFGYLQVIVRLVSSSTPRLRTSSSYWRLKPCPAGARTATSAFVWAPGLAKDAARFLRANVARLTFARF